MIFETIVTTVNPDGKPHIAPIGIHRRGELYIIAPFRPSTTLSNVEAAKSAVINTTDDVRVFAGCLTGRYEWPIQAAERIEGVRLTGALAHIEVRLESVEADELRPRLICRAVHSANHAPFQGFNRAQAAVIEAAILISRLTMLPPEKIESEINYLRVAMDKTAGDAEREAWGWLMEKRDAHRAQHPDAGQLG